MQREKILDYLRRLENADVITERLKSPEHISTPFKSFQNLGKDDNFGNKIKNFRV